MEEKHKHELILAGIGLIVFIAYLYFRKQYVSIIPTAQAVQTPDTQFAGQVGGDTLPQNQTLTAFNNPDFSDLFIANTYVPLFGFMKIGQYY